jgi:hypothetical protein
VFLFVINQGQQPDSEHSITNLLQSAAAGDVDRFAFQMNHSSTPAVNGAELSPQYMRRPS